MKYLKGNLLAAPTQALVNTVNTVGVMGKGIALQFKERFPNNFKLYAEASKSGALRTGKMFVTREQTLEGERIIINFPTKTEWYRKSQYKFIEEGLEDLVSVIENLKIESIAVPPLGCGNGGLKWERVREMMQNALGKLEGVDILIYEPNDEVKAILQNEQSSKEVKLTPARAMILLALFKYEKFGEPATVFAANKLAYFLQESGEKLRLKFDQYQYGPYAQAVEKVLYALNGKFLKGLEQMTASPFEPLQLNYNLLDEIKEYAKKELTQEQWDRLANLFKAIDGFESTLSLEILSSTHFTLKTNPNLKREEILAKVQWNDRKQKLITQEYVDIAYDHLKDHGQLMQLSQ
jgi:O-acetyl-ADP-ribose deacetylase (regulator of RNase III)